MRRKALLAAAIAWTTALGLACDHSASPVTVTTTTLPITVGSGVIVSESRAVAGFDSLAVTGPLKVVVDLGGAPSLEITADDNIVPLVTSEVRGNRLHLAYVSQASFSSTREVVCRVTTGTVGGVDALGAAKVELRGVDVGRLEVRLSGASSGTATGTAEQLSLDASAASRWSSPSLASRAVTAVVAGASQAVVRARDTLVATVAGASTLEYLGDPVVTPSVSGVSVLRRVGD